MSTWSTCTWGFHSHFFSSVMVVALEHSPFLVACVGRETKARNPSLFAPQATAGPFVRKLTSFALCCCVISLFNRLQPNHKHNGKECGSVVSSRFFGGSVVWHPKKQLRRRRVCWLTLGQSVNWAVNWSLSFCPSVGHSVHQLTSKPVSPSIVLQHKAEL